MRVGLAVAAGLLYAASEPPWSLGGLAFVALVPLFAAIDGRAAGVRFLIGWVAGTVACSLLTSSSVYVAVDRYFALPEVARWCAALVVPQVYGAPWFGAFAVLAGSPLGDSRRVLRPLLVVPAAWVACEFGRSNLGHGLPWVLLAHSQVETPLLLQPAAWGGAFAVSFLVVLVNLAVWELVRGLGEPHLARTARRRAGVAAIAIVVVLAVSAGDRDRWRDRSGEGSLRVSLVQAAVPASWGGSLRRGPEILRRLSERTSRAAATDPVLVVWPENALGFVAEANPERLRQIASWLPEGASLVLGSPRSHDVGGAVSFRNAALLIDDSGRVTGGYAKTRLTPFAETWPGWIPAPSGVDADPYVAGHRSAPLPWGPAPLGVLICSEAIHPDLARDRVRAGAQILVNLANDAWFGGTPAIDQHFAAAALRAVENRRPLLRASNLGVSAIVTPWGEVRRGSPEEGVLSGRVSPETEPSWYSTWGDVFAWLSVLVVLVDVVGGALRRRLAPSQRGRPASAHPQTDGPHVPGP